MVAPSARQLRVLAGRKHLAIDTLSQALERIGYRLQITPRP